MKPYFAHPTAILDGETEANGYCDPNIGEGTRIWHHAHVMAGARIGPRCILGQNVFVGATAILGEGCKVQNNVNLYDGVVLEDFVFCGPSMTFTNLSSPLPRAAIPRRHAYQKTVVRRHASIGAGAVIVCGHELGEAWWSATCPRTPSSPASPRASWAGCAGAGRACALMATGRSAARPTRSRAAKSSAACATVAWARSGSRCSDSGPYRFARYHSIVRRSPSRKPTTTR